MRTAMVGAGLAGLTAAGALAEAGEDVVLFEKARGPGGRTSTRRTDIGAFDHGAQYFTARDPRFVDRVSHWIEAGNVASSQRLPVGSGDAARRLRRLGLWPAYRSRCAERTGDGRSDPRSPRLSGLERARSHQPDVRWGWQQRHR